MTVTTQAEALVTTSAEPARTPFTDILREITRGGVAGLIVGILLAGIGGRLVMRLAALLVPDSVGLRTENGNVIGAITAEGTILLIVFGGLIFGVVAGALWVVIRPWLPADDRTRALVAVPIALAAGLPGLVQARNPDFAILRSDPLVIASLVALVALFGPALVLVESWLDRHLPVVGGRTPILTAYVGVAMLGTASTLSAVIPIYLGSSLAVTGAALIVVGLATLATWWRRTTGRDATTRTLTLLARVALGVAVVSGLVVSAQEVVGALAYR